MKKTAVEILREKLNEPMRYNTMQKVLEAMEEYANQSKWISVKDRLPESQINVIVFNQRAQIACIDVDGRCFVGTNQIFGVTHWQPLPEKP